jgi:hypothetical protein
MGGMEPKSGCRVDASSSWISVGTLGFLFASSRFFRRLRRTLFEALC